MTQMVKIHRKSPFPQEITGVLNSVKYSSTNDKADAIYDTLKFMGLNNVSQVINNDGTPGLFKKDVNVKLAYTGEGLLAGTSLVTGVIEQVTPYIQNETLRNLFPEAEYASQRLLLDVFDPIVGMTHDTPLDTPVPIIEKRGVETQEFQPKTSQEAIEITQEQILFLRDPGNQNISLRGLAMYMAKWTEQLAHRGNVKRLNDIYTAIFQGQYYWGAELISYGIPTGNRIHTVNLSGYWGTIVTGTSFSYNPLANPILDLTTIFNNILLKYRGLKMKIVLNYMTNQLIVQNPNVIARTPFLYANNNLVSNSVTGGVTLDTLLRYYLGGDLGIEVIIDNSNYIADVNDPNGYVAGTTNPVLPNYKIWVYIDTDGFGMPLGEYAYTLATQKGGTSNPQAGKYFYLVDSTLSQTFDGISQPRINIAHGWNGSPRLQRYQDIWTIDVSQFPSP